MFLPTNIFHATSNEVFVSALQKPTKIITQYQLKPHTEFYFHDFTAERSWVCSQIPRKFILLSFHQTCSASDSNSSSLNDFEQFYDFLMFSFANISQQHSQIGVLKVEENAASFISLLSFTQPYWSFHSSWIPLSFEPPWHAWTNARTWMLFYWLGSVPSLLHVLPWPTRAAWGNSSRIYVIAVNSQTAAYYWPRPIYSNLFSLTHSNITELATPQVASDKLLPVGQYRPK